MEPFGYATGIRKPSLKPDRRGRQERAVLLLCYHRAVRKKRSISMPPDLDSAIEAAAAAAGMTYSGWLAAVARREFLITRGLEAVAGFEAEQGPFSAEELTEADAWVEQAVKRSARSGTRTRQRRSA